jgi:CO/xanthine dehydrogenase FAD-binding subunit
VSVVSYSTAASLEEAMAAMASGARPVAGGTDLVVGARQGKAPLPERLVAIHRLEALRGIEAADGGGLRIGALATHEELAGHQAIRERFTALADAAAIVGSHATRAQGTLGGNLMNASPAMETGGPLVCFEAVAELRSKDGSRSVPVAELLVGPAQTSAEAGELLTAVQVPAPVQGTGSCYARLEYRRQMEIAVVGATAVVSLEGDRVADARIAITALAPTIHRVSEAEQSLVGTDGARAAAEAAAAAAAAAAAPISDVRASADYRRAMAAVIARRAIEVAVVRAGGQEVPIPSSAALHGGLS